jgi:hypothetical protein
MDIGIPNNFLSSVASSSSQIFSEVSGVVTLLIGIFLAFMVIELVINALRGDRGDDTL